MGQRNKKQVPFLAENKARSQEITAKSSKSVKRKAKNTQERPKKSQETKMFKQKFVKNEVLEKKIN
jgi:hypothetical protein